MWCVVFFNKQNDILHTVCMENKPTDEELDYIKEEIKTDPEFNHIVKDIKTYAVIEVDMDFNECVKSMVPLGEHDVEDNQRTYH